MNTIEVICARYGEDEYGTDFWVEDKEDKVMDRAWRHVFDEEWVASGSWLYCLFSVSARLVHARPVSFYRKLLRFCEDGTSDIPAISWPYTLERMWWHVFLQKPYNVKGLSPGRYLLKS